MAIINGTGGDDTLRGTAGNDDFHLEQGGEDRVTGGRGSDVFYLGSTFDAADSLTGGSGDDFLVLDGDYSSGVTFRPTTMKGIEHIELTGGSAMPSRGWPRPTSAKD